jgi:hypothetical protein
MPNKQLASVMGWSQSYGGALEDSPIIFSQPCHPEEKELISDVVGSFGQIHLDLSSSFWANAQLAPIVVKKSISMSIFPYLV